MLKVKLHRANVLEQMGIKTLLCQADGQFPRLSHLWLEAGYRGQDKGADWVRKTLGWSVDLVERPKKPVPEEVLKRWAREWAKEGVAVNWQKLLPPKGNWYSLVGGWWSVRCRGSRPEQAYEQRLREAVCERGGVGVRLHDSPHDEAARACLRTFHTVSEGEFSEVRIRDGAYSQPLLIPDLRQGASKPSD